LKYQKIVFKSGPRRIGMAARLILICFALIVPISALAQNYGCLGGETNVGPIYCPDGDSSIPIDDPVDWMTVIYIAGDSDGTPGYFSILVFPNYVADGITQARSATLTMGTNSFFVTEDGIDNTFHFDPTTLNFPASGGTLGVIVMSAVSEESISVNVTSGTNWLSVAAIEWQGAEGDNLLYIAAQPNVSNDGPTQPRSGTIQINNEVYTVSQDGTAPADTSSQPYKGDGCQCSCPDPSVGDPIRLGIGNLFEKVTDYTTAGANALEFTRYYNSLGDSNTHAAALGGDWRSTYDRYLRIGAVITAERPDGQELIFTMNGGTAWTSDSDVDFLLVPLGLPSGSVLTLTNSDDSVETYSQTGVLTSIQQRDGYTQTMQYNGYGQLISVIDSFGRGISFTYEGYRLQSVTTPSGLVLTYGYNSSGAIPGVLDRLASVTYSTAPPTSQTYIYENPNLPFALTGIIDENGNRFATFTYDSSGRATSSQHARGADLTTVSYNDTDGSRTVTNVLGLVTVYKFTTLQGVPKVTEIDRLATASVPAATRTQTYDANGYLARISDWNTNLTIATNDYRGLPLAINQAVGTAQARIITNAFLSNFHLPLQNAGPRELLNFTYDSNGNMLTLTERDTSTGMVPYSTAGQTRTWTYTYDSLGHVLTSTGPRMDVIATTTYTYDATNNLSTITDALGHVTQITNYSGSGLPLTIIDPNNVTATLAYDARDRLLSRMVQAASGNATTAFGYDTVGDITSITLPDGSEFNYQYDAAHRLQSVSNLLGDSVSYTLDAAGNIIQQTTGNAQADIVRSQSAVFDQLSRMLQQIGAYSETTTYGYDSDGNRTSFTDGLTNTTLRAFDALSRLVASIDPLNNTTGYGYDPQDNVVSVTDPRSLVTSYVYDGFRRVIQEASPDKGTTVYILDKAGNRISQTDARGVVTLRTFDSLNRVTSETYPASPGENITYTYDATSGGNKGIGRLTGYTDETGSTTLTYNERGDVISTTRLIGGHSYTTAYGYDLADHVTSITYPSGDIINYTRDSQGRIASVSYLAGGSGAPSSLAANVTYMPFGPVSRLLYGNGLARTQDYDLDYRLDGIQTSASGANVQNLSLGYDAVNDITSITDNLISPNSQTFRYDEDYRLTQALGVYGYLGYTYDPDANRLTSTTGNVTQTYNYSPAANMLQSTVASGVTRNLAYTLNGNLSSDNRGTTSTLVFNYGNRNRYNALYSGAATVATYQHNALGERLVKTAGTTTTHYHYDQRHHLIAETQPGGALIREYVWLDDMPLAQIEGNGAVYYIHPDQLNSPQKMTDATQTIVWGNEQQPFGETVPPSLTSVGYTASKQFQMTINGGPNYNYIVQATTSLTPANWVSLTTNGAPFTFTDTTTSTDGTRFYRVIAMSSSTNTIGVTQNLRFPGQYFDAESGLNYNMMRDYDPTLGRYIQNDPIGGNNGHNVYAYVKSNPMNFTDRQGLNPERSIENYNQLNTDANYYYTKYSEMPDYKGLDPWTFIRADSRYYFYEHNSQEFEFNGQCYSGGEVNYYVVGMALERFGYSQYDWFLAEAWNWEVHNGQFASLGELYWINQGRQMYRQRQMQHEEQALGWPPWDDY
jgi:RHS repeat-associated protein